MEEKKINNISSVCVYCASSTKIPPVYFDAAKELGRLLGERKLRVVNGAGNIGLMCAVSDAALAAGGTVTGVIPHFMVEQDWYHKGLTELIEVETMHERKQLMANLSDAVIALPGGCGTLEELLEIITWKQLGLYLNPIVILNINHYYDPLLELLRNAMNENFMRPQHAKMWAVADTPEEAIRLIHAEPKWDASLRKGSVLEYQEAKRDAARYVSTIKNEYDNEKTRFINDVVAPVKDRFILPVTDGRHRGERSA